MTKESILQKLHGALPTLKRKYPLRRLALFGSYAREDAGPDSDIDLLVDVDPSIGLRFVDLAEDLERILGRKVDLVSSRGLQARFRATIDKELINA